MITERFDNAYLCCVVPLVAGLWKSSSEQKSKQAKDEKQSVANDPSVCASVRLEATIEPIRNARTARENNEKNNHNHDETINIVVYCMPLRISGYRSTPTGTSDRRTSAGIVFMLAM